MILILHVSVQSFAFRFVFGYICQYVCYCLFVCVLFSGFLTQFFTVCILTDTLYLPLRCSLFICIIFKMKSLSNLIFETKSNGNMFDRNFILKMMQKKSEHLRGISPHALHSVPPQHLLLLAFVPHSLKHIFTFMSKRFLNFILFWFFF